MWSSFSNRRGARNELPEGGGIGVKYRARSYAARGSVGPRAPHNAWDILRLSRPLVAGECRLTGFLTPPYMPGIPAPAGHRQRLYAPGAE